MSLNIKFIDKVLKEHWQVKPSKGGKKMLIRTRQEIKNHRETIMKRLEDRIDKGLEYEKRNDDRIALLNKELEFVSSEVCYEETLSGDIEAIERIRLEEANIILHQLSKITGKEYYVEEGS